MKTYELKGLFYRFLFNDGFIKLKISKFIDFQWDFFFRTGQCRNFYEHKRKEYAFRFFRFEVSQKKLKIEKFVNIKTCQTTLVHKLNPITDEITPIYSSVINNIIEIIENTGDFNY